MSIQSDVTLSLEDFLPYRLSRLSNLVSAAVARVYSERYGLQVADWRVMALVHRMPGSGTSDLAQTGALDKVAVTRALSRLEKKNLVLKKPNEHDRRRQRVYLTIEGRYLFNEIAPAALRVERQLLENIDPREWELADRVIRQLRLNAEALLESDGVPG